MAEHLHRRLHELKQELLYVGSLVEEGLARSIHALLSRDDRMAQLVIEADREIDRMEVEVEHKCLDILALHQPVAHDLRFVVAVLKINNDLERIGDLAKNIAKRVIFLSRVPGIEAPCQFQEMSRIAQRMVKHSLDALVRADTALARQVLNDDDAVDSLRDEVSDAVRAQLRQHPEETEIWLKVGSVSRHLERLADMATHIAEEVIYMVDGNIVRHRAG
jgi:phosphate transport system protein